MATKTAISNSEMVNKLFNFVGQFENSLMIEYKYMEDIAHGIKNARPSKYFTDCSLKHFSEVFTAVNYISKAVVGVAADFAGVGFLVEFLQESLNEYVQEKENNKIRNFASDMVKHSARKRALLFKQIANEVMRRYGACIAHFLSPEMGGNNSQLDILARTGAIRLVYYALKNNISFEDCDQLVSGLREGFKGFPQESKLSEIFRGVVNIVDPSSKKTTILTAEGLYTQSGYMCPAHSFPGKKVYGYAYFISQTHEISTIKGVSSKSATVAYVPKAFSKRAVFGSLVGVHIPNSADLPDNQVPLYGYISVPDSKIATEYSFRQHRPPTDGHNHHLSVFKNFRFRYVSFEWIGDYLFAMKNVATPNQRVSFNEWLASTAPYNNDFPSDGVKALFRGHIRKEVLDAEGLRFSDGIFRDNDFSYCHFHKITFGTMQSSLMIGCTFVDCVASGAAFNFADLSLSTIEGCQFTCLKGELKLKFAKLVRSNFVDFDCKPCDAEDYEVDYLTKDTFVASSINSNNEVVKDMRERQIEEQFRRDREQRERENYQNSQRQHQIWEEVLASNDLKNEEKAKRDEEARARWEARMEEEFNSIKQTRMNAVDPSTLGESISQIREPVRATGTDSLLSTLMETIFFQKPMKMLKLLKNNADVIKLHSLPQRFDYSTNGRDGEHGINGDDGMRGAPGGGIGTDGTAGGNGQNATSAIDNTVCLMSVPGQQIFVVSPHAPQDDAVILPMLRGNVRINLSAVGGVGGNGGAGGIGGNGTNGQNGRDATSSCAGTSGTNGGNGGRGGNGGMGGNAGHSANVNVMCKVEDTDLLMLIGDIQFGAVSGGKGGPCGLGGRAGNGGDGGSGSSYYNGEKWVSIPGGAGGAGGIHGNNGNDGRKGLDGKPGSLTFSVVDVATGEYQTYKSRYLMELVSIAPFYSTTGIIEPGQRVEVNKVTICNSKEMPSPPNMVISLKGTRIVVINDDFCKWTSNVCLGRRAVELPEPRYFKVAENLLPASLSDVPFVPGELTLQAKLPRINYEFTSFNPKPMSFLITHPVDLSVAGGMTCCVYDTHVPVVVTVRNKTRVGMGKMAAYPRILRVTLQLPQECGSDHRFRCADMFNGSNFTTFTTDSRICFEIDYLPPYGEMVISGSIAVNPKQVSLYQSVKLQYSMCLGHIDHPNQLSHMEVIQQRTHSIQVAEYCRSLTDRDCVLVISSVTSAEEIKYWRELFARMGKSTCIWNVSLYVGVTYSYPQFDFKSTTVADRIVVILNAPFKRDDEGPFFGQQFYPVDYLEKWEIFEAARRHGLRTLIVNYANPNSQNKSSYHENFSVYLKPTASHPTTKDTPSFDGRVQVYKFIQEAGAVRDEHLPVHYQNCRIKLFRALSRPTEEDFNKRMDVLATKITALRPDQQYYVFKAYQAPEKSNIFRRMLFWARYDIGDVDLRRGLDTTYAVVASKCVPAVVDRFVSTTVDLFVLVKLLPLKSKLNLFCVTNPEETLIHEQLSLGIASDIADEQSVFIAYVRRNGTMGTNKKRMLTWLTALSTFGSHDYSELCQSTMGQNALKTLLCKLVHMGQHYGSAILAKKGNFMCNAMRETCQAIAANYLQITPGGQFRAIIRDYTKQNPVNSKDEESVMSRIKDPHNTKNCGVLFNHWMPEKINSITTHTAGNVPPTISKMRSSLPDVTDAKTFRESVTLFSKNPQYAMAMPALLAPHPNETVLKEDTKKSAYYFVRGMLPAVPSAPAANDEDDVQQSEGEGEGYVSYDEKATPHTVESTTPPSVRTEVSDHANVITEVDSVVAWPTAPLFNEVVDSVSVALERHSLNESVVTETDSNSNDEKKETIALEG